MEEKIRFSSLADDLVMIHQKELNEDLNTFQMWELRRSINIKFYIYAVDGNGDKLASQHIQFSDFKYDRATMWVARGGQFSRNLQQASGQPPSC